jgi:hypothetical protein
VSTNVFHEKTGTRIIVEDLREVLLPKFIPFMEKLTMEFGPGHIVQEDNAGAHASKWNKML